MTVQVFVDESRRKRVYLTCAVLVNPKDVAISRTELRGMLLSGQRRLHFTKEKPQRRRSLLVEMTKLPVRAWLYSSTAKEPQARQRCIAALLRDLTPINGERLVIEHREASQDAKEGRQIATAIRQGEAPADLSYDHLGGHEEPLLWIADAVAWAYGAGGEWRRRVNGLIENVQDVDSQWP